MGSLSILYWFFNEVKNTFRHLSEPYQAWFNSTFQPLPMGLYLAIKKEERTSSHGVVQEVVNLHRLLIHLRRHLLHGDALMFTHRHKIFSFMFGWLMVPKTLIMLSFCAGLCYLAAAHSKEREDKQVERVDNQTSHHACCHCLAIQWRIPWHRLWATRQDGIEM